MPLDTMARARLSAGEHAEFLRLGGSTWLRAMIAAASAPPFERAMAAASLMPSSKSLADEHRRLASEDALQEVTDAVVQLSRAAYHCELALGVLR